MSRGRRKKKQEALRDVKRRSITVGGDVSDSVFNTGNLEINYISNDRELLREVTALETTVSNLSSELSKDIAKDLEHYREQFREGRIIEGTEKVRSLRERNSWPNLDNPLRASILRAEASMIVSRFGKDQIATAVGLADEAAGLDPKYNDRPLRLNIELAQNGYSSVGEITEFDSVETYNIGLAILLNTKRYEAVVSMSSKPPSTITLNAESYRFYALAFLAIRDVDGARREILKAKDLKPDWLYVRYTNAIIDYFSALSPQGVPQGLMQYPPTVSRLLVRSDDQSQTLLKKACQEFNGIWNTYPVDSRERREIKIWEFVCRVNSVENHYEGVEFGRRLLNEDPGNTQLLFWFFFRGYEYDLEPSLKSLEERVGNQTAKIEDVLCCVLLNLALGRPTEALKTTEANASVFEAADADDYRWYWRMHAYMQSTKLTAAKKAASKIEDPELKRAAKIALLTYESSVKNDPQPLFKYFMGGYKKFNDDASYIAFYEFNAHAGIDKEFIRDGAERFCDVSQTAYAVNTAARALLKNGFPRECNEVLLKHQIVFPGGRLPHHLRKVRIAALQQFDIPAAAKEAALLSQEDNTVENLSMLIGIQREKGDLLGLQVTARSLLAREDAPSADLLRAAQFVTVKDRSLAARLWKKAVQPDITSNPELVAFAQGIASKLGLERESRGLMQQMMSDASAGRGPMKQMSFADAVEWVKQRQVAQVELDRKYGTAETPTHVWADKRGLTLAQLLLGVSAKNAVETDPSQLFRIMGRSGARIPYAPAFFDSSTDWNLHLDISTLLLAQHLDILDLIESAFKPIKISRHVITALLAERDKLTPHQQSQLDNSAAVAKLVRAGKLGTLDPSADTEAIDELTEWISKPGDPETARNSSDESDNKEDPAQLDLESLRGQLGDRLKSIVSAAKQGGYAVGFLPLTKYNSEEMDVVNLPERLKGIVINARSVANSLLNNGKISQSAFDEAVETLGIEGREISSVDPEIGSKLFLMPDVEGLLAGAEILSVATENFKIYADEDSISRAHGQIEHYAELKEIDQSLDTLLERLNQGLDDGQYEFIVVPADLNADNESNSHNGNLSPELKSVLDIFAFNIAEHDVIAVDDRSLSRYGARRQEDKFAPLLGINEILQCLLARKILDEDNYFAYLTKLRRSGYRYIPFLSREVHFHLERAQIGDEGVVESEDLITLRQQIASCLLDREFLDLSNTETSEAPFVIQTVDALAMSMVECWKDDSVPEATASSRSEWIFENLFVSRLGTLEVIRPDAELSLADCLATDFYGLYVAGFMIESESILEPPPRRREYFNWLNERVTSSMGVLSAEVVDAVGKKLRNHILQILASGFPSPQHKALVGYVVGRFVLDLPQQFRIASELDEDVLTWLRVKVGDSVTVEGKNFEARTYWKAMAAAIKGGTGKAALFDAPETEFTFALKKDETEENGKLFPTVDVLAADGNLLSSIQDPTFSMLLPEMSERLEAIKQVRYWFDCNDQEYDDLTLEICGLEDAADRVMRLYAAREESAWFYYRDLETRFGSGQTIAWNDLLPRSVSGLAGYFRIPREIGERSIPEAWESAGETLLNELGLELAISRCSHLPLQMPQAIVSAFKAAMSEERVAILKRLGESWASPIRILHLANLVLRVLPEDENLKEIALEYLHRLYTNEGAADDFEAFVTTLSFVYEGISSKETGDVPLVLFASWAHASNLYQIQRAVGLTSVMINSSFGRRRGHNALKRIEESLEFRIDCSSPSQLNRTKFLTHAAARLFAGIDPAVVTDIELDQLIKSQVFPIAESDGSMLAFTLYHDPLLCKDQLGALFGGDRFDALSPILGDVVEPLRSEKLKDALGTCLRLYVENPADARPWLMVFLMANGLPVYEELRPVCREALDAFQTVGLIDQEKDNPSFLVFAAAEQVGHFDDPQLREKFRGHILDMLELLTVEDDSERHARVRGTLVDAALWTSWRDGDPARSTQEFTEILESIFQDWPDMKHNFGQIIAAMPWDANYDLSKYWWRLNLKVRSQREPL